VTVTVNVNGVAREIEAGTTLGQLIAALGVRREGIAVARNDDVVSRSAIDATPLCEGDAIEVIAAVAGG
jgi:thiamine biosynthesis protein ThiS